MRGLAHHLKPVVMIGQHGLTEQVLESIDQALDAHELIKLKFIDFKDAKKVLALEIEQEAGCEMVGMIGNTAIFFRRQPDEKKQKIRLPSD